jgi:hypothetical protein
MGSFYLAAAAFAVGFGIGALSVGFGVWARALFLGRHKGQNAEAARDLAMQSVLAIDDFVGACHIAAHDYAEYDVDEPEDFFLHADDPVLLLPKDANWALLDRELAEEIRWLPNRLRNVKDALESIEIDPPEFNDLFEHRQDDYAHLGLRAMDLIERICREHQLPLPVRPDYFDPREGFLEKTREMNEFWKRRAQSAKQVPEEPSNVTPIFGRPAPSDLVS